MHSYRTRLPGLLIMVLSLVSVPFQAYAANSALMELIQILKNKGSITEEEYQLLQKAAAEDEKPAVATAQPESSIPPAAAPTAIIPAKPANPSWTEAIVLKGDVRVRYQNEQEKPGLGRDRGRVRYRLGITAQPTPGWEVGAGLASGATDPRSTNQSFAESFTKKPLNLDYSYVQYQFSEQFKLVGGKFRVAGYLNNVSDLIWDTDINPEGVSANFTYKSNIGTSFVNSGLWVMEEVRTSNKDTYLAYLQLGQSYSQDNIFSTITGTYYSFEDNSGFLGPTTKIHTNTNSEFSGIYNVSGEIGLRNLISEGTRFSLFGELVENSDTASNDGTGYLLGFKGAYDLWSFRYNYARLERNSWPDFLPDSNRYEGRTGIRGHEFLVEYAIMKNILLGVNYYLSEQDTTGSEQDLLQLDLNVRF